MRSTRVVTASVLAAFVLLSDRSLVAQADANTENGRVTAAMGEMPLHFIENQGVFPENVAYYVQGVDKTIMFTANGLTFALHGETRRWVVKLDFMGAIRRVRPTGELRKKGIVSYFTGAPENWITGLPTFGRVVYRDLWPGIDLVYRGTVRQLKYEFVVHPGADPSLIRLRYRGAERVSTSPGGGLLVETPEGRFEDGVPVAWQDVDGKRVPVVMKYALEESSISDAVTYGFQVGDYDTARCLIMDPAVIVYCGYIGGSNNDYGKGIAVDRCRNAYVTGYTYSAHNSFPNPFPVSVGPDLTFNGVTDAFIAKVSADGRSLVYCGYIGGQYNDYGLDVAVDGWDHAYVTGYTNTSESDWPPFPVINGPDLTYNGNGAEYDAFVAKVNIAGTALEYCGYIGGKARDYGHAIAVDSYNRAYVAGTTDSDRNTFPVTVGPNLTHNGGLDGFVARVNANGLSLSYCGYVGGRLSDEARGVAVGSDHTAYVTGFTQSPENGANPFPVLIGPDLTHNGNNDAFVARIQASGLGYVSCGYIGGANHDYGYDVALDPKSKPGIYVAGVTMSTENDAFPVTVGPDLTHNGGLDAFVAKVKFDSSQLEYCGYIGGQGSDYGYAIAADCLGNAYVTGCTFSAQTQGFPLQDGPSSLYGGNGDAFVSKVNSRGTALAYSGYISGDKFDTGQSIAVDEIGDVFVTGYTASDDKLFPKMVGPDLSHNGNSDAFVAKITAAGGPIVAYHHRPVYVVGGYRRFTVANYDTGIFLLDAQSGSPSMTRLIQPGYDSEGFRMDWDNKHIVFGVRGTTSTSPLYDGLQSGLFRLDPCTGQVYTIYAYSGSRTAGYHAFYKVHIDQDGDYLCGVRIYDTLNPSKNGDRIWKIGGQAPHTVTEVLNAASIRDARFSGAIERNVNTGKVLICDDQWWSTGIKYPVYELDQDGTITTWNSGIVHGWHSVYGAPIKYFGPDEELLGPDGSDLYRLRRGNAGRVVVPGLATAISGGHRWDLQTAVVPRIVAQDHSVQPYATRLHNVVQNGSVITSLVSTHVTPNKDLEFYRGRHVQTIKTGTRTWDIRLSCPRFPNRFYRLAASISGVRPAIPLPDGRTVGLAMDPLTLPTFMNALPFMDAGPLELDCHGEAVGELNLTGLPRLGLTLWIAMIVFDASAPSGIAYLPDTYAMRI